MVRRIVADYYSTTREFTTNARLFLVATFLSWIGLSVNQVVFNLYLVAGGYREDTVGGVTSLTGVGMAVAALPSGWAADRFGRRAVLRAGAAVLALGLLARALSLAPFALYGASFVLGVGQALITIASSPFMSDNSLPNERTHLFSMHFVVVLLAGIAGNLLGGELPGLFAGHAAGVFASPMLAYRGALVVGAFASLLALVPLGQIAESVPAEHERPLPVRARDHAPLLAKLAVTFLLLGSGAGLIMPFFNLYFARRYGATAGQIGIYFSVAQVITLVATLLGPLIAQRLGKLRAITLLQFLSLPFLVSLGFESGLAISVLAFWMRSAFMQMSSPLLNSYAMDRVPPQLRARAHGIDNMCWYVGWSLSSALAGVVIARFGYSYPYYLTALLYGVATLVFYLNFRPAREDART